MAAAKLVLITTSFFFVGPNAYDKVGLAHYCNLNPAEFTAECNYETLKDCASYLGPGEHCAQNPDYQPPPTRAEQLRAWIRRFIP